MKKAIITAMITLSLGLSILAVAMEEIVVTERRWNGDFDMYWSWMTQQRTSTHGDGTLDSDIELLDSYDDFLNCEYDADHGPVAECLTNYEAWSEVGCVGIYALGGKVFSHGHMKGKVPGAYDLGDTRTLTGCSSLYESAASYCQTVKFEVVSACMGEKVGSSYAP